MRHKIEFSDNVILGVSLGKKAERSARYRIERPAEDEIAVRRPARKVMGIEVPEAAPVATSLWGR